MVENALPGKSFKSMQELQSWTDLCPVRYSAAKILKLPADRGCWAPAERFADAERGEPRATKRAFFTDVREETRKADKCGLIIRNENRLYELPKQYADRNVLLQITDTEIMFKDADGKTIRTNTAGSVYTARPPVKSTPISETSASPDFDVRGKNSLERPPEKYEAAAGGTWQ